MGVLLLFHEKVTKTPGCVCVCTGNVAISFACDFSKSHPYKNYGIVNLSKIFQSTTKLSPSRMIETDARKFCKLVKNFWALQNFPPACELLPVSKIWIFASRMFFDSTKCDWEQCLKSKISLFFFEFIPESFSKSYFV